jgi:2-polyprenyl-3-methyl-5-hydroxy-6-metoxy-1,4-benzoquinol methylase
MKSVELRKANAETRRAWNANAAFWDERMAEGNDFFNLLEWPATERLLAVRPGQRILDIACGNGLTSRRLASMGARVDAFDFSEKLIALAGTKPNPGSRISYSVIDGTDEKALLELGRASFDAALCNMALFDMADIAPLFTALSKLLKPGSAFVFSLTHPALNQIKTVYSVKISRYLTPSQSHGIAMQGQPRPQLYFDRPLQYYFNLGFENGFVLDGFEESAFPPERREGSALGWNGNFSEIPPVLIARLRLRDV